MAVWSIVRLSELAGPKRLDAEYYRPDYQILSKQLAKHKNITLDLIAQVTDGIHGSPIFEPGSGIRYISAKYVRDCYFDLTNIEEISYNQHKTNPRTSLRINDIIISTVGTIGFCAVVDKDILPANCDRHVGIVRLLNTNNFDPHFIAAFINTKYGRVQTIREATGNVQLNLFIYAIKQIHVPIFDSQREIGDKVRNGLSLFKDSEFTYLQAERMVLEESGWDKLDLSQLKWWTAPSSQTRDVRRLDAEHFQPKYDNLIKHLRNMGKAKQIRHILAEPIQKGVTPNYEDNGEIVVVNSQHLGRYCLNFEGTDRTNDAFWKLNKQAQIRQNDIMIYATGAYIGRANAYIEKAQALAGVDLLLVRPTYECNPLYLSVFLNSPPGLMQSKRFASGSGQAHIYPGDVANYWIYIPSEKFQQQVADLVQQSYQARQQAKALLEEAKSTVEALIEGRG